MPWSVLGRTGLTCAAEHVWEYGLDTCRASSTRATEHVREYGLDTCRAQMRPFGSCPAAVQVGCRHAPIVAQAQIRTYAAWLSHAACGWFALHAACAYRHPTLGSPKQHARTSLCLAACLPAFPLRLVWGCACFARGFL